MERPPKSDITKMNEYIKTNNKLTGGIDNLRVVEEKRVVEEVRPLAAVLRGDELDEIDEIGDNNDDYDNGDVNVEIEENFVESLFVQN